MHRLIAISLMVAVAPLPAAAAEGNLEVPEIGFQKHVLDNGLTLIVHEDRKAPIVAVNVWYHVGSKNEKPGRTGFAHLYEHLMFNGSEHFNDDYFQAMDRIGATDLNGTTSEDRTNYFQNVPTSALDVALWLESDRMGHMLPAIDQAKLDEQRGVVQNEKRQFENQPYALSYELITRHAFPAGHPYSWTVIGSMEDLEAATLEDVHHWFEDYYGADNAVIVLAGDVDFETAKQKVEHFFGHIPSGPPLSRPETWVARRSASVRQMAQDRVPQARLYKVWNVPEIGSVDHDHLELVADVLAAGKNSRLYKRLVYDEQIAREVDAYVDSREIASLFHIEATAQPGVPLRDVERAVDEELQRLLDYGPTVEEIERVRTLRFARFVRGIERIGGFGGKSDILARSEVFDGDPAAYRQTLLRYRDATATDLQAVARRWLSDGAYILEVLPFPDHRTTESAVDRASLPQVGQPPTPRFVTLQRSTLGNGMRLLLAERHALPVVNLSLLLDAGYASDQFARPGTAKLALDMMDEGTESRTALEISRQLDLLGARLSTSSNLDMSVISLDAMSAHLGASLELLADVVQRPSFPEREFARLQKLQIAAIEAEKKQPVQMALRVFPALLYGSDHAYGTPFTGSGTVDSVAQLTREDLQRFHRTWIRPNNATLVVVGDTTLAEIQPLLERLFATWETAPTPHKNISTVAHRQSAHFYLIDKPGAIQSIILAGHVAPPRGRPNDLAIDTMNTILGGSFTSRLNMNLREDKHWSYGAGSFVLDAKGQRPFLAYAPVQSDKTKESIIELKKELVDVRGDRPVTSEELDKIKNKRVLELPGTWETNSEIMQSLAELVRFDLEDDYFDTYADRVASLGLEEVAAAAHEILEPEKLVWVVVGDGARIASEIRELGFGDLRFIDADGRLLERP